MKTTAKIFAWTLLVSIALGSYSFYAWEGVIADYSALEPDAPKPTPVRWVEVQDETINDWIHAEGTARAVRKVHLAFEVNGRVAAIARNGQQGELREGIHVFGPLGDEKGQLIAQLDDADYAEELRIAKTQQISAERNVDIVAAQLQQSRSQLDLANLRLKRIKQLLKKQVSSPQQHDEALAEYKLARASVISSEAQLAAAQANVQAAHDATAKAQRNFERTRIHAPWSGVIGRLNIRVGDYVDSAMNAAGHSSNKTRDYPITLIDPTQIEVPLEIPLYQQDGLKPGNRVLLQRQTRAPQTPEKQDKQWYPGTVYTVAPMLSPQARSLRVVVRAQASGTPLLDGELLQVKLLREQRDALVIPVDALLYRDNQPYVFLADSYSGTVERRDITTGIREGQDIEVREGLSSYDTVVTDGRRRIMDGDTVTLLNGAANTPVAERRHD